MSPFLAKIDLSQLYPPFREKAERLAAALAEAGTPFYAICGTRTFQEQARLYFQGRTTPGPIVTRAQPGQSAHNYGCAIDFCRDADVKREGLQPDWNIAHYVPLQDAAHKLDLEPGMDWIHFREGPHVQLRLGFHGVRFLDLKLAHDKGGLPAVWAFLDTKDFLTTKGP